MRIKSLDFSHTQFFGLARDMQRTIYSSVQGVELQKHNANTDPSRIHISTIKTYGKESAYENNVYFREGLVGAYVSVGLSDKNLQRLQEVFGPESIKKGGEGNVLLKGEAERFVSGWFNDIAYQRGYVNADSNQDGILSEEEKKKTNSFSHGLMSVIMNGNSVVSIDLNLPYHTYLSYDQWAFAGSDNVNEYVSNTIEEELNLSLERDSAMKGSIKRSNITTKEKFIKDLQECLESGNEPLKIPNAEEEFLKILEPLAKQLKELAKELFEKQGIQASDIKADSSLAEVFKQIMENPQISEEEIKESLQDSFNQEKQPKEPRTLFQSIQDLTKLDEETLQNNLQNNPNFEEDIISIVQEIAQNMENPQANRSTSLEITA